MSIKQTKSDDKIYIKLTFHQPVLQIPFLVENMSDSKGSFF